MARSISLLAAMIASACATSVSQRAPVTTASSLADADDVAPLENVSELADYTYNAVSKRDPFASVRAATNRGDCRKGALPYEADQLKLVFTTTASSSPMALVVDPAGRSHMLTTGDVIGQDCGVVSAIGHEDVTLTDAFEAGSKVYPAVHHLRMAPQLEALAPDDFEAHASNPSRSD
jgi:Tfp pilus assembly protein PilP